MTIIKIKRIILFILFTFLMPSSALAGNLVLKSFGHSSFLIKGEGKSVLINPFKSGVCTSGLSEPKSVKVDFIFNL